jgi:DNA repair protein RecO (recombination protein O)
MQELATGLILRTRPLTETSLIVHWLTRDQGRIATVAKGARRPKSPFRGKLDLFFRADFSFVRSRRSDLHTLREVSLTHTHPGLRLDLHRLEQAAYATALIELATETDTPIPGYLDLLEGMLLCLDQPPTASSLVLAFELRLLAEAGLQPDLQHLPLTPDPREILLQLSNTEWEIVRQLQLSPAQRREANRCLEGFLLQHLGRVPRQRAAAVKLDPPTSLAHE